MKLRILRQINPHIWIIYVYLYLLVFAFSKTVEILPTDTRFSIFYDATWAAVRVRRLLPSATFTGGSSGICISNVSDG